MYQIGYSNESVASGLVASYGAKSKDLVRVPPAAYVDAVLVEVVPAIAHSRDIDLLRAQVGIRLYSTIFNYREGPAPKLCISA
jgi:hypothetical protein